MNRSDSPSLQRTLALAAAVAALGASIGVPLAQASAEQAANAPENQRPRTAPPPVLAFTLVEQPAGQQQGMGDGSTQAARKGAGTKQLKIEKGASQHKSWGSQAPSPAESRGIIVVVKPGAQAPASGQSGGIIAIRKPGGQVPAGKSQVPAVQKQ